MKYVGKDLKTAKKISNLMAQRTAYLIDTSRYLTQARPMLVEGSLLYYGKMDSFGAPVEPIYDYSLESLEGTNENFLALEFVADQYAVMKRKYELNSLKSGAFGTLNPARATIRGDLLYESHLDGLIDVFISILFSDETARKVVTFHDFCRKFISYIKMTRAAASAGGVPISKSLFYLSASAPVNVTGLVIDFEVDGYHDDAKKQQTWLDDPNFDLYCSAATYAGFYIDHKHPYRIIANIAHPKMQRASEYTAGSSYQPGTASNIFDKYYFRICLYEFLILKNKLFVAWDDIVQNRPVIKRPAYCKRGTLRTRDIHREFVQWQFLVIPPIPGRKKENTKDFFRASEETEYQSTFDLEDRLVRYGLHNDKYNLIYWLKFYIEVRYTEIALIKNFLTEKEKNAIVKTAVKYIRNGDIELAFDFVGASFQSFVALDH